MNNGGAGRAYKLTIKYTAKTKRLLEAIDRATPGRVMRSPDEAKRNPGEISRKNDAPQAKAAEERTEPDA